MQIDSTSFRSPNHSARPWGGVQGITLHTGEGTRQSDLGWLCNPRSQVSAHYYVCRDGAVYQMVDDARAAWHAGHTWGNHHTIGIETEHQQGQDWPDIQRATLADLCRLLIDRYGIVEGNIVAHRWLTPARKIDPTDWPDHDLRPWISDLYRSAGPPPAARYVPGVYLTIWPATVRQGCARSFPIHSTLPPGTRYHIHQWVTGETVGGSDQWAWLSPVPAEQTTDLGIGFAHGSAWERVE